MKQKKYSKKIYNGGQVMLTMVLFFLLVSTAIVFGIASPILKQVRISKDLIASKESYFLAEGGLEDAFYRIKNGKTISSGDTNTVNGYTTTITITTNGGDKTIDAVTNRNGIVRKMESTVTAGVGTSFNYGIQSGAGGFVLNGGAKVVGNVYSNGDIVATNGVTITGSAVAANSAALSADQSNDAPTTPTDSVTFGNASATQDFGQSFQTSVTGQINYIQFYIKKVGSPSNITVKIVSDNGGVPGTNVIDTATLGDGSGASAVTTSYGWVTATFSGNVQLTNGTTYWVVLDGGTSSSKYYILGANSSGYSNGVGKIGQLGSTWNNTTPSGLDGYFRLYLGGLTSTIGGDTNSGGVTIGSAGIGDAWAHAVQGATIAGSLYCQTSLYTNKSCNTSRTDPPAQGYPVSDANITDWKAEASSGGVVSGDYTVGSAGGTLGPKEITGNLLVNGGGTLTVSGTLWVHGTVTLSGGGKIKLSSTYGTNSGVIVSDGIVSLAGGGTMSGSGQTGSYLMILTTSNCPFGATCGGSNALTLSGGAGAVVLNAQNGNMVLNGGSGVHEATAYQITASGGAVITYDSGLANVNFSSGPSGGWNISSWLEVQ